MSSAINSSLGTSTTTTVLPSLHEMFPEHLLSPSIQFRTPYNYNLPLTPDNPSFPPLLQCSGSTTNTKCSFDLLLSDPRASSLAHIASASSPMAMNPSKLRAIPPYSYSYKSYRYPQPPSIGGARMHSPSPSSSSSSSSDGGESSMADASSERSASTLGGEEKKHPCSICGKRFNRPSSLKIHCNTHTGAMPFRCPYPACGRAFNVNSNMRRHFRNHSSPGFVSIDSDTIQKLPPPSALQPLWNSKKCFFPPPLIVPNAPRRC
ncbi:hypothetical protein R3P38DRAFT_2850990 [Favolaschia claudopus]|uniref:C2H2-type domain-containing protein n=1 Tax=Favolaschia claudopus TaxID=2862362 RepID=A0AAW0DLU6_9AGAR